MRAITKQATFSGVNGWGGRRRGAGRPNKSGRVSHERRETVDYKKPLHLTLKVSAKKWDLRCEDVSAAFKNGAAGAQKFGLRILHYSILRDHIHLIVEAKDNHSLAQGMRSFGSRLGIALRKIFGGSGPVFKGRYHLSVIKSPSQMKNSLAYVLQNFAKHSQLLKHVDQFSSAAYFNDWSALFGPTAGPILLDLNVSQRQLAPERLAQIPNYLCQPKSWLAREGWLRASPQNGRGCHGEPTSKMW